jgi:DNA-directed RNA polymerase specialized sigma24 family protein
MEGRFCEEDGMAYLDSIFTEPTEDDVEKIDQVRKIIDQLPPREADFIELYYFKHLRQTDIAIIFGVSQPTVCYRLNRAADRIKFLLELPEINKDVLTKDLSGFLSDPLDIQIMVSMWETTCQSEVAKQLGVSQGLVRHRFLRTLNRMRGIAKFEHYVKLFEYVAENLNILREVQRPVWNDGMIYYLG